MYAFLILLSLPILAGTLFKTEGFVRLRDDNFVLEGAIDQRFVSPTIKSCDPKNLEKLKNLYVRLEWEIDKKKKCYITKKIEPMVYDPLRATDIKKAQ